MSDAEFNIINTKVGLVGGTVLLIGNVIAMTVFLMPAWLIAEDGVGPEIALAMVAVSIPITFSILGSLQVGGAMPAAGGSYVYASRLISPFFGFLLPWIVIPAIWFGQVFLATGFAEFARVFVDLPLIVLMYMVMIPFILVNVFGIRVVAQVQFLLVAIIVGGMLAFIVPGLFHIDTGTYTPMFQDGLGPFFVALVSLTIAMHGFGLATDLGEELKDPVKNIPRVLALSAVISITLMVAVVVVAVGVVESLDFYVAEGTPPDAVPIEAGVAEAAGTFLPSYGYYLVALAAVVGAFTSLNTLYTAYSRQLMRAARDETIPLFFAKIHERYQSPYRSILLLGIPGLTLVPLADPRTGEAIVSALGLSSGAATYLHLDPVFLSVALAATSLIGIVIASVALWNLPKRFPQRYEYSIYKLPMPLLKFVAVGGAIIGIIFLVGVSAEYWWLTGGILSWMALSYPAYRFRRWWLREKKGVDLAARMKDLHEYEQERAEAGSLEGEE